MSATVSGLTEHAGAGVRIGVLRRPPPLGAERTAGRDNRHESTFTGAKFRGSCGTVSQAGQSFQDVPVMGHVRRPARGLAVGWGGVLGADREASMSQTPVDTGGSAVLEAVGMSRRRAFLLAGLAGSIGAAMTTSARRAKASPPEVSADIDPNALLTRLVSRSSFGLTTASLARAVQLGYSGFLEEQLAPETLDNSAVETRIASGIGTVGQAGYVAPLATIAMTGEQLFDSTLVTSTSTPQNDLIDATIVRAILSPRQLYERMVEFWSDHFNIAMDDDPLRQLKVLDDRLVIRALALTTFPQLLRASAQSPAMMNYLNNDLNQASSINENYARELMELHTVGVNAGYSQDDVIKVARCLTGWTWYSGSTSTTSLRGTFRYNSGVHDVQAKAFLGSAVFPAGFTIPARSAASGQQDGIDIINFLANSSACASFIAGKLCRRFLGPSCPASVISKVAQTYLNPANPQGVGDIKAMLRVIFSPNVLADSPMLYKRPFHLMVSAIRTITTDLTTMSSMRSQLSGAGHLPFAWSPPDGYPENIEYWAGLQLPRWNYGASVATGGVSGVSMDITRTAAGLLTSATTATQIMDIIDATMFASQMSQTEKSRIRAYLPQTGTISTTFKQEAVGLAIASPGFQMY